MTYIAFNFVNLKHINKSKNGDYYRHRRNEDFVG